MRVFIGLPVPLLIQPTLDQLVEEAKVERSHHPSDRHMTLFFLGKVDSEQVSALIEGIDGIGCKQSVKWSGSQLGPFPSRANPKVWALEGTTTASLSNLRDKLAKLPCMQHFLREGETKGFRPHISLSRSKLLNKGQRGYSIKMNFSRLSIFKSDNTGGNDPRYCEIVGWDLE